MALSGLLYLQKWSWPAAYIERIWIAEGARHRPERQNSYDGITLIVIDPFAWIEPVAHLSERKVCARVKRISVTSRLSCRVFNPHFGTFGKYSDKFGFRKLSEKFGFRITFAFGHTLFFIAWIRFEFFIIFWLIHVFTITFVIISYTKIFWNYPSWRSVDCNTCKNGRRLQLRANMNCPECKTFGFRITFAFGHTLFFIAWIRFEFFTIFWLIHVFTITFVIISYTKIFWNYPSWRSVDCNTCKNGRRLQLRANMNCPECKT